MSELREVKITILGVVSKGYHECSFAVSIGGKYVTRKKGEIEGMHSRFSPHPDLSPLCNKMWQADDNRLEPGVDYEIEPQGRAGYHSRQDKARYPLFSFVKQEVFERDTYKAFMALLDNYERETGRAETVTKQEEAENRRFIDAIIKTEPMKLAHQFLVSKRLAPREELPFKKMLYNIWFQLYGRTRGKRVGDSSGFEHVFVGETRGKEEVIGFHNWIQFYLQEKAENVDYNGFFPNRKKRHMSSEEVSESQLLTIQFQWKQQIKPLGSTFIGTSPEFEMALYTVCFLAGNGKDDIHVELDDYDVIIKVHRFGQYIGSCYPQAA